MAQTKTSTVIKQLLADMGAIEDFLDKTKDHMDPRTMAAMQTRQHEFMEKLDALSDAYRNVMRQQGFAIFLVGGTKDQASFAKSAQEVGSFVMSANAVYDYLAEELWPAVRAQDQFQATHVVMLIEHLVSLGQRLGMNSMPNPAPTADLIRTIGDKANLSNLIRLSIERTAGTELSSAYLEYEVTERALQEKYSGTALSLLITDASVEQIQDFRRRLFRVNPMQMAKTFVISIGTDKTGIAEFATASLSEKAVMEALAAAARKYGFKVSKNELKSKEAKVAPQSPSQEVDGTVASVVTSELTETKKD